ncbi:MAG: amino acid ABC transporter substrate-binding protein, partial [Hyphomicrobiales bacterium]|nr:amino acid ABC transporter substrate-binding protein [Hyphomicrobiales bacterium]
MKHFLGLILVGFAVAFATSAADAQTLNQVKQRGQLICGTNTGLA